MDALEQTHGINLVETHGQLKEKSLVGEVTRRKRPLDHNQPNTTMCGTK